MEMRSTTKDTKQHERDSVSRSVMLSRLSHSSRSDYLFPLLLSQSSRLSSCYVSARRRPCRHAHCRSRRRSPAATPIRPATAAAPPTRVAMVPEPTAMVAPVMVEVDDPEFAARLRRCTQTGRPCGDVGFLAGLERILNRVLAPRKAGRRPRNPDQRTHNAGGEGDGFQ